MRKWFDPEIISSDPVFKCYISYNLSSNQNDAGKKESLFFIWKFNLWVYKEKQRYLGHYYEDEALNVYTALHEPSGFKWKHLIFSMEYIYIQSTQS